MIDGRKVLAIIPARGGSKGLPGKNILNMNGKPLIHWTMEQAKTCSYIDDIHVSTDSQEIFDIASQLIPISFLRPDHLGQDSSDIVDVAIDVLNQYESRWGKKYDLLVLLEPTSPLRAPHDISKAIELFSKNFENTGSVVSVGEIHMENPFRSKIIKDGFIESLIPSGRHRPRQELPTTYFPYGVFYGIKPSVLKEERTFFPNKMMPYYTERWQNFEIDDHIDFLCIEKILSERNNTL